MKLIHLLYLLSLHYFLLFNTFQDFVFFMYVYICIYIYLYAVHYGLCALNSKWICLLNNILHRNGASTYGSDLSPFCQRKPRILISECYRAVAAVEKALSIGTHGHRPLPASASLSSCDASHMASRQAAQ